MNERFIKECGNRIRNKRISLNMTQDELAKASGYTSRTSINKIEAGLIDLPQSKIAAIAKALDCTPAYLMGFTNNSNPVDKSKNVWLTSETYYFVFKVKECGMYPNILEDDELLCIKTDSVKSGDIAVVCYNDKEAIVRKINYVAGEDWLELIPFNSEYQTIRIEGADLELCYIQGKVIRLIRKI